MELARSERLFLAPLAAVAQCRRFLVTPLAVRLAARQAYQRDRAGKLASARAYREANRDAINVPAAGAAGSRRGIGAGG